MFKLEDSEYLHISVLVNFIFFVGNGLRHVLPKDVPDEAVTITYFLFDYISFFYTTQK